MPKAPLDQFDTCRLERIAAVLSGELHDPGLRLVPSENQGSNSHSFVCTCSDGHELFAKAASKDKLFRSAAVLNACPGCPFLPRIHLGGLLSLGDEGLLVTDRMKGHCVSSLLDLSHEQYLSWLKAYLQLSVKLQPLHETATATRWFPHASKAFDMIDGRFHGSKAVRFFLSDLLSLREKSAAIDNRLTQVIHGDFTFNNFLFSERKLSAILDFDNLTLGLPCEDLIISFALCFRDTAIRGRQYGLLCKRLQEAVSLCGWPTEDWHAAIDVQRLRFAILNLSVKKVGLGLLFHTYREDRRLRRMHAVVDRTNT